MISPSVSVLLPVLDEIEHIEACVASLLSQQYSGSIQILVAEGGSIDGTADLLRQLAGRNPMLTIIANPQRRQSHGLNRLIEHTDAAVCVRADAHTTYAADYVSRSIEVLESSGAALVGGPMRPIGITPTQRAIAAAMTSSWAVGPAPFRSGSITGDADTVYLGAMRTSDLRALGGFRHLPSGVAEDADLAQRVRLGGGRVFIDSGIRSEYRPRGSFGALWRQFHRYGRGKVELMRLNGRLPSWRPLAPLALLIALVSGFTVGVTGVSWWPLLVVLALWGGALLAVGSKGGVAAGIAAAVIHLSYASGSVVGLFASPSMRGSPPSGDSATHDSDGERE